MRVEIIGTLYNIGQLDPFPGTKFRFRNFCLKHIDEKNKEQIIKFRLSFGRVELLEGFEEGDRVKVTFCLEGREGRDSKNEPYVYSHNEVYIIEGCNEEKVDPKKEEEEIDWSQQEEKPLDF